MKAIRERSFRRPAVAAAFLLILAVTAAPAAGAQQSQEVVVTAAVDSYLTITLCDLSAEFGSGLTALGTAPTLPHEVIFITSEGTEPGEGVFYVWQPFCPGDLFLTVESNLSYDVFACATAYDLTEQFTIAFPSCGDGLDPQFSRDEHDQEAVWYLLRVDDGDEPGTFQSTTTWSVVAS